MFPVHEGIQHIFVDSSARNNKICLTGLLNLEKQISFSADLFTLLLIKEVSSII